MQGCLWKVDFLRQSFGSNDTGALIQRKKSGDEISRERDDAAQANEQKHQRQMNEMQQRQFESQQRVIEQQARQTAAPAPEQLGASFSRRARSWNCSSIAPFPKTKTDATAIAAITGVNAACGSNTLLMQSRRR